MTKKEIFYLKKRSNQENEDNLIEPKVVPFVTFEDIKKDLDDFNVPLKEREHLVIR